MKTAQLSGIMIFAIGAILLAFAYHASNAPVDQLSNTFTGHSHQYESVVRCVLVSPANFV